MLVGVRMSMADVLLLLKSVRRVVSVIALVIW